MNDRHSNWLWSGLGLLVLTPVLVFVVFVFMGLFASGMAWYVAQHPDLLHPTEPMSGIETVLALIGLWLFVVVTLAVTAVAISLIVFAVLRHVYVQERRDVIAAANETIYPRHPSPAAKVVGMARGAFEAVDRLAEPREPSVPTPAEQKRPVAPLRAEDVARFESPAPKPTPKLVELAVPDPVTQYYLLVNKERRGPYTAGQLRKQLANKEISRDSLCREVDGSEWLPLWEELLDPKPLCTTCKVEEVEKVGETCPNCRKFMP